MADIAALPQSEIQTRSFINDVYHWMLYGLSLTGVVAWWVAGQPALLHTILANRILFFGLMGVELVLVIALAGWVTAMSPFQAALAFLFYAALNGVTLSVIFVVYTSSSIASAFFITAGTFAFMSVYGYVTKTDLTTVGNFCVMALIGVIIASVVNIFLHSSTIYWVTTYLSVFIFIGLTAYDTQKIKALASSGGLDDPGTERKAAIRGALTLYLDFINLFLSILRATGRRR